MREPISPSRAAVVIDAARATEAIVRFLRDELARPPRHMGFVVDLDGGTPAVVTAALAVRATDADGTVAVLLEERGGRSEGLENARDLVGRLRLPCVEVDLTPLLESMGNYEARETILTQLFADFGPGWSHRISPRGALATGAAHEACRVEAFEPDGTRHATRPSRGQLRRLRALRDVESRLRSVVLYREAESRGMLVAGSITRTELVLGAFARPGPVPADVEPVAGLYQTQVFALAHHLGLPKMVTELPRSAGAWSTAVEDEDLHFHLPYDLLDPILDGIRGGVSTEELARTLFVDPAIVERVRGAVSGPGERSQHFDSLPRQPDPAQMGV